MKWWDLKMGYDHMKSEFNQMESELKQIKAELRKIVDEMREEVRDINNIRGGWTDATRRVSYWADQLEQPLRKEGE